MTRSFVRGVDKDGVLLFGTSGFTPSGLGDSLPLRFVGGLQHHSVVLWAVSTLLVRVFISASGHGVILCFIQHRWAVVDSRVFLCRLTSPTEILLHVLRVSHAVA